MILCFTLDNYPRRPLPPAPYLVEEPRKATAALEAAIRACPTPTHCGSYPFPTNAQKAELYSSLDSPYLTHREAVWLELWHTQLDTHTAAKILPQLRHIIDYRKASGITPVAQKGGAFFPERLTPSQP